VINHAKPQHGLLVGNFVKEDGCNKLHGYVLDDDDGIFPQHKFSLTLPVDRPILIGLSQGFLCFYSQHANPNGFGSIKTTVIWKPAINKTVVIDVLDVLDALPYNYITVFGFGVCPHTSDPKLVKIICSHKMSKKFKSFPERVEVFRLSSGYWRRPHSNQPHKSISFTHNQVVIDDFIYWLASDLINDSHMIVSFDTIIEDFTEVYLPDGLTRGNILISKLMESLVVLENSYGSNVRVWRTFCIIHTRTLDP
ncbi:putative F-box domain-containing protein, partial [Tanacetum coccineum]